MTNTEPAQSARQTRLATALEDEQLGGTAEALGSGAVSAAHAAVIAAAINRLPEALAPEQVRRVEADLLAKARRMDPARLRRAARRALQVVEHDQRKVDAAEDRQLREEETLARARTRFTMRDNGDGTVSGWFTVPTLAGAILGKVITQLASPRRAHLGATNAQGGDRETRDPGAEDFD